jgi:hypothetical protein
MNNLDESVKVGIHKGSMAATSVTFNLYKRVQRFTISASGIARTAAKSLLYHEIGTHVLRNYNELNQPWRFKRN